MKHYYFFLFSLLLLLTAACSLEERLERREDRLVGTWVIDRAFFKEDGNWFRDNLNDDFEGDRITFFSDYTLLYDDVNGQLFDGVWELSVDRIDNGGDSDIEFFLDADFFDALGRPAFTWLGNVTRLTNNNMRLFIAERNGRLDLRLDKID